MPQCDKCKDAGLLVAVDASGNPRFEANGFTPIYVRCSCKSAEDAQRRQGKLAKLDGLTDTERKRTFDQLDSVPHQKKIVDALEEIQTGLITLQGAPGLGKSHLMHCKVNQMRAAGKVSVYATMPDILDYLKRAFNPSNDVDFGERWDLLIQADCLAVDELDEFRATDWAMERFLRLVDERYRNQHRQLTLFSLNGDIEALHPKVASRINSGTPILMKGFDLRKVIT